MSDQLWAFPTQQCSGIVRRQSTIFCFTFISLMAISASDGKLQWRMDKDVLANELYAMSQRDVVVAASRGAVANSKASMPPTGRCCGHSVPK